MKLTPKQAREMAALLRRRFPWIGTDENVDGADVIDALNCLVLELEAKGRI